MGLLDVLNGMQNGPRGQRTPTGSTGGGGMSPITMAILGLLAYKALKHVTGGQSGTATAAPGNTTTTGPAGGLGGQQAGTQGGGLGDLLGMGPASGSASRQAGTQGGGLGDLLGNMGGLGGLGGLLAGGAAGSVLSGGLNDLLKQFQQAGQGEVANSWVGTGPNKQISPNDLSSALGEDQIRTLSAQTGLSRDELIAGLQEQLPNLIDQLTPQGRLPTEQEMSRMI